MNEEKTLDERWLKWSHVRMRLACGMSESVATLREHGFSDRAILAGFEVVRPRGNALADGAMQARPLIRRALHRN